MERRKKEGNVGKRMEEKSRSDETFVNINGYLEYKYPQGKGSKLVHRRIAFKEVYNPEEYSYNFEEYEVHHNNLDKLDNRPENLELQLPKDHYSKHFDKNHMRIDKRNMKISDYAFEKRKIASGRVRKIKRYEKPLKFILKKKS